MIFYPKRSVTNHERAQKQGTALCALFITAE